MQKKAERPKKNPLKSNQAQVIYTPKDIDNLLQFIGQINWDIRHSDQKFNKIDKIHPLRPIFDAVMRIKLDQDELLKKHKHAEEINQVLFSISNAVNTTPNLDELFKSIHRSLSRIIDATNFWIGFYDKTDDSLTFNYIVDTVDKPEKFKKLSHISAPGSSSHAGFVIRSGQPVLHTKAQFIEELEKRGLQPLFTVSTIWLGVPLKIKDEVIGVMAVHSFTDPDLYDEKDVEVMLSVSEQVAVAIARKRAEDEVQKSEARFRHLLQNIPGIAIQGYLLDGTTTYWNQASERLYGYTEKEAIRRNLLDLIIPPGMQEAVKNSMLQMTRTGQAIPSSELYLMRKDGSQVAVYSNHALVRLPDSPVELFCLDIDLTELKQAEEERDRLEAENRQLHKLDSLGRMAGAIAHHFNNQLSVVMGNIELVLNDLSGDPGNREKLLESMKAVHKATVVSRQMLSYIGQIYGKQEPVNLSQLCRQSLSLLQVAIPKGITLKVNFPVSGPVVQADKGQIQQILTHLITNAWESISENQGCIGLTIKKVAYGDIPTSQRTPFDWQPQNIPHACLEVTDTGTGISKKDIEKIFDPFFTTKFTGRGMGLSVARGMVKAHRGCIIVDSEPGRGSIFRIYLPILTGKNTFEQGKPTSPSRKVETAGTILLIEDEEMVRNMAKAMLTRLGYSVIEAPDGIEAVQIFQQRQDEICCVLSDLTMPRMNGWDTLTELRKMRADLPVILVSGYDKELVIAGDHPELPQVFLNKPYQMAALKDALVKAMGL